MNSDRPHSRGLPVRNVRLDDERWTRITTEATRTQTTASDVIRAALDDHGDRIDFAALADEHTLLQHRLDAVRGITDRAEREGYGLDWLITNLREVISA